MSSYNSASNVTLALQIALVVGVVGLLAGLMYWTYVTPTVNGQHIEVWSFIGLWARELAVVGFIALVIMVALTCQLCRWIRRLWAR